MQNFRTSSAPLHDQVRRDLYERVREGEFRPDRALPNEEQLCSEYGVSRITIRRAIGDLCAENILFRRHGVGTFVTDAVAAMQSIQLRGNLGDILASDKRIQFRFVARAASEYQQARDVFGPEVNICRIDCAVRVDGEIFALAEFYIPQADAALLPRTIFTGRTQPILRISERLGRPLLRADQVLMAVAADSRAADILGLLPGGPIMEMTRIYFDVEDIPLALVIGRFHPARFRIHVALQFGTGDIGRGMIKRRASRAPSKETGARKG